MSNIDWSVEFWSVQCDEIRTNGMLLFPTAARSPLHSLCSYSCSNQWLAASPNKRSMRQFRQMEQWPHLQMRMERQKDFFVLCVEMHTLVHHFSLPPKANIRCCTFGHEPPTITSATHVDQSEQASHENLTICCTHMYLENSFRRRCVRCDFRYIFLQKVQAWRSQ